MGTMYIASCRSSHRPFAFTLVEILVAVGILLLLAAILFPVFNSARYAARTTTCQSNLRQIGIALQQYVSDYNRRYPGFSAHPLNCGWSYNIAPYAKSNAIFACPEDLTKSFEAGCPPTKVENGVAYNFKGAYSFNMPPSYPVGQMSDVRIRTPSQMILVLDGLGEFTRAPSGTGTISPEEVGHMGLALRHKGSANCLFADGHVKWLTLDELAKRSYWTFSGSDTLKLQ